MSSKEYCVSQPGLECGHNGEVSRSSQQVRMVAQSSEGTEMPSSQVQKAVSGNEACETGGYDGDQATGAAGGHCVPYSALGSHRQAVSMEG